MDDLSAYSGTRWHKLYERVHALGWQLDTYLDPGALPRLAPVLAGSEVALVLDHFGMGAQAAPRVLWDNAARLYGFA